jgi:hypothetical protein
MEGFFIALVKPFVELNPIRYWFNAAYKSKKKHELGKKAKWLLCYQIVVVCIIASLIAMAYNLH